MTDFDAIADEHGITSDQVRDIFAVVAEPTAHLMNLVRLVRATDRDLDAVIDAIEAKRDTTTSLLVAVLLLSETLPDPLPDAPPEATR